jgi:hypothetical protein
MFTDCVSPVGALLVINGGASQKSYNFSGMPMARRGTQTQLIVAVWFGLLPM